MQQLVLDIGLPNGPTLDNFFVGGNTDVLAHLRQQLVPGSRAGVPTYLWGDAASGKSHLLQAVRSDLIRRDGLAVGWMDASQLQSPAFHEDWDVIILDDVHLYGADQQQAAFNWFVNALSPMAGAPRWVLAAGDLPPADLPLRDDLRSRLGWGLVFQLRALEETDRRAVLRHTADARGLFLGDDVVDFMLNRFSRDLGSLMQLLDELDGYALETRRAITIPLIKSMLENR